MKHYLFHVRRFLRRVVRKLFSLAKMFLKMTFPALVDHMKFSRLALVIREYYGYDPRTPGQNPLRVAIIARDARHYPKSSLFIRLISPLSILAQQGKVDFSLHSENSSRVPVNTDVIIVQRTAFDTIAQANALIAFAATSGIPIILDNDDDFRAIDSRHPEYELQKERCQSLEAIAKAARQIWLSTPMLAESYGEFRKETVIFTNAVDGRLWAVGSKKYPRFKKSEQLRMVYMGTATHDEDFKLVAGALGALHEKYDGKFSLTLIGVSKSHLDFPWLKRLYQPKGVSLYPKFVRWFLKQGPYDVGLAPLHDSPFNNGKSDIKCLDYLVRNVHPIASDVTPYSTSPLKQYITLVQNEEADWYRVLEEYIVRRADYRRRWKQKNERAIAYVRRRRTNEQLAGAMHRKLKRIAQTD